MEVQVKRKIPRNDKYLTFIRNQPCIVCNQRAIAHHVRDKSITPKFMHGGSGLKPSDYMCVPLCPECHEKLHKANMNLAIFDVQKKIVEYLVGFFHE